MADGYTYELRVKDLMSRAFARAGNAATQLFNRLNRGQRDFLATSGRIPNNIQQLEKRLTSLSQKRDVAFSTKEIRQYNQEIRQTEKQLDKLRDQPPDGFLSRLRSAKGLISSFLLFGAFTGFARLGADLEQTRISFQTLTGSIEKGNELLADVDEFANMTPFSNSVLQENTKLLLNFGFAQERVIPTLQRLGDVSGGNAEKMNSLTLAFAQVSSAGKLQGQDLMQMINAGFNPLQEIARTTGESMAVLRDRMSQGAISAQMVENAFISATSEGGMFQGMMEKQSQSLGGKWSTFMGKLQSGIAKTAEKLAPVLGKIVDFAIQTISWLGKFPGMIKRNLDVLIPLGVAVVALVLALKGQAWWAAISMKGQAFWTGILTAKQWLLNIALNANPIGLIVAGIALLIAGIAAVVKKYDEWKDRLIVVSGPLSFLIKLIVTFGDHWKRIKEAFSMGGIMEGIKAIGVMLIDFMLAPLQYLLELASYIPGLGDIAGDSALTIKNMRRSLGIDVGDDNRTKDERLDDGIYQLSLINGSIDEKMKIFSNRISNLDMTDDQRLTLMDEARQRLIAAEESKKKRKDDRIAEEQALNTPGAFNEETDGVEETTEAIATGGKKQFILNVQIDKVLETVNQYVSDGQQSADELTDMVMDEFTRRLHGTFKAVGQ